jgi:hypothetical protein
MPEKKYTLDEVKALKGSGSADNLLDAAKSNWVIIIAIVFLVWNLWQSINALEQSTINNARDIQESNRIVNELAQTVGDLASQVDENSNTNVQILSDLRLIKEKLNVANKK